MNTPPPRHPPDTSHADTPPSANRSPEPTHGPEAKLLDRVRNWVDVFPWLRLVRVCRVAGGPVWISHTFVVLLIWTIGCHLLAGQLGFSLSRVSRLPVWSLALVTTAAPSDVVVAFRGSSVGLLVDASGEHTTRKWMLVLWTIAIWLPTAMALLRVGSLLTAGRDMPSYWGTFRVVCKRLRGALLIVFLPSLVASLFWLIAGALAWAAAWAGGSSEQATWASWVTLPIVLPATILAAMFVVAGRFAVPLAIAAVMIESDPDPLDALSRGYEYTLRRLPQLALLLVIAAAIAAVVVIGFQGVSYVGLELTEEFGAANSPLRACLELLPAVIGAMLLWSMIGGVYLLLRQSAGGQEVEDIVVASEHWKSPKLPSVQ